MGRVPQRGERAALEGAGAAAAQPSRAGPLLAASPSAAAAARLPESVIESVIESAAQVLPILELYTESTDGSFIENKETAVVWHYCEADPDFGSTQVRLASRRPRGGGPRRVSADRISKCEV